MGPVRVADTGSIPVGSTTVERTRGVAVPETFKVKGDVRSVLVNTYPHSTWIGVYDSAEERLFQGIFEVGQHGRLLDLIFPREEQAEAPPTPKPPWKRSLERIAEGNKRDWERRERLKDERFTRYVMGQDIDNTLG